MGMKFVFAIIWCCLCWVVPSLAAYDDVVVTGGGTMVASEEAVCGQYNGSICADYVHGQVLLFPGRQTMEEMETDLEDLVKSGSNYGTADCIARSIAQTCHTLLRPCMEIEEGGTTYAIGAYTCQSNCMDTWDSCRTIWNTAILMGVGDVIPSCTDTPEYSSGQGGASIIGKNLYDATRHYTRGDYGQPIFPSKTGVWVSPNGVEYTYPCNDYSRNMTFSVEIERQCFEGLTIFDEASNTCMVPCPHPLFSKHEYGLMRRFYVVPTLLGSVTSLVVFFDSLYIIFAKDAEAKEARKLPVFTYSLLGSMVAFLYFLFGALPVVTSTNLVCGDNRVLGNALDYTRSIEESQICTINRGTIYLVMILFNIIFLHLMKVKQSLENVWTKQVTGGSPSHGTKNLIPRRDKVEFLVAFGVPTGLCLVMYMLDDLDPSSSNFQGQLARWSFICGPRLGATQEAFLVHVPFLVTGVGIVVEAFQSLRLVSGITRELRGSFIEEFPEETTTTQGMISKLQNLAHKLSILGIFCTILVTILIWTTVLVIPKIDQSSMEFVDYVLCVTVRILDSNILKSAESCEALYDRIGGQHVKYTDANFQNKPPALLISMTFLAQSSVVCAFGFFYFSFVFQRRRRVYQRQLKRSKVFAQPSSDVSIDNDNDDHSTTSKRQ